MLRPSSRRRHWWLAIVQVVLLLISLAAPAAAATDSPPLTGPQLIELLRTYGVVKGDESGNLLLDRPIKRAEMFTIIVRAMGLESQVDGFKNLGIFDDAKDHWADGYIGLAAVRGIVKGDGNRLVRPEDSVSVAEALTLIVRLVDKEPTVGEWPYNVLVTALELGVVPPGVTAAALNMPAIRGSVFESMAESMVTVKTPDGQTVFQKNLAPIPPTVTIATLPASTGDATVQVTGTTQRAVSVTVNGASAQLGAGGSYSANVSLAVGANKVTVVATDAAGNKTTAEASITRALPIARLEISGPAKVGTASIANYTISAFDSANQPVSTAGITATVEGNIGVFNLSSGNFAAGAATGSGKIILTAGTVTASKDIEVIGPAAQATQLSIRSLSAPVPVTREMTVVVEVRDDTGLLVEDDYGRSVTLSASGVSGVQVTTATVKTEAGLATFKVKSPTEGAVVLTAVSTGLATATGGATFGSAIHVALTTEFNNLVIGGSPTTTRIRAELRDDQGNPIVNNTDSDIVVSLSTNRGFMSDSELTIRRNYSSSIASGDDGRLEIGDAGAAVVTGTISSGHKYTVSNVSVNMTIPSVGSGSKFELLKPAGTLTPGDTGTFILRVIDTNGNPITAGSYAFQLKVDTSNDDPKTDGVPANVSVSLGGLNPVSDGIAEGATNDTADVIGRTVNGIATIDVTYTRSGSVTLTPIPMGATNKAYSDDGTEGAALASTGLTPLASTVVYAGSPNNLAIEVDSDLGTAQAVGATANNAARFFTVKVKVLDSNGDLVENATNQITIAKTGDNGVTTVPSVTQRNAVNGIAEFRIQATSAASNVDTYTASASSLTSATVDLFTRSAVTDAPEIIAIRGVQDGTPRQLNVIGADDTHMEIDLVQIPSASWVSVKVYAQNSNTLLYRSDAVDMSASPQIRVPKSKLVSGNVRYQVVLHNGFGDSVKSDVSAVVTNAKILTGIVIHSAKFNTDIVSPASPRRLTVSASGLHTTDGTIDTSKLWVVKGANRFQLSGAPVTINSSSQFTVDLSSTSWNAIENSATYGGADVKLEADAGWFMRTNGDAAAEDITGNLITPLPHISAVTYNKSTRQFIIDGSGLAVGTFSLSKLKVNNNNGGTPYTFLFNSTNASQSVSRTDSRIIITLTQTGDNALTDIANFTGGGDTFEAEAGWIQADSSHRAQAFSEPVYTRVTLTSVTYTAGNKNLVINGSGFGSSASSVLTPGLLKIIDMDNQSSPVVLTSPTSDVVDSDSKIIIELTTAQHDDLMTTTVFAGNNIYVEAQEGWLIDANGRSARPIPSRTLRLPQP